jgi:hypothetical protein
MLRKLVAGSLAAAALVPAVAQGAAPSSTTVASATAGDLRAVLVAQKSSGGSAPTATVTLTAYERSNGHWRRVAGRRLAGTFFWHVVGAPRSLCRFELRTAGGKGFQPRVVVQLLLSPSLGCGAAQTVLLPAR